jgi:hypothetical protein
MKIFHFLLIVLFAGLSSCDTLVTEIPQEDLPSTSAKLVVNSFLSPQAIRTIVVVTESVPLYGESSTPDKVITNATVTISDGVLERIIPYDSAGKVYSILQTQFPIKASKTYKITVSDPTRSVTSTCTIPPNQATIQSYAIDTAYVNQSNGRDTAITIKMTWKDIAGEKNFYRVRGFIEVEYSVTEGGAQPGAKEKRVRSRFNFDWDDNTGRSEYSNDVNLDGQTFTSPLGKSFIPSSILYYTENGPYYAKQKPKLISLTMEVLNTDQAYYDYHRSIITSRNSDNPFAEPALVFTNINGGLGCLAAYNSKQIVYRP